MCMLALKNLKKIINKKKLSLQNSKKCQNISRFNNLKLVFWLMYKIEPLHDKTKWLCTQRRLRSA